MTTPTNPTPDQPASEDVCPSCGYDGWQHSEHCPPESAPARAELRANGLWHVIYSGTVVGRHHAKFRALEQVAALNAELDS